MAHVTKISIKNFKAIDNLEADFKGCTAIITGGNNKGKTSFLRGLPDRIRFVRPDVMVKEGKDKGSGEMVLTTGEKFLWEFDKDGKDKLTYITSDGVKQSVTKDVGARFFPATFDIDKFLQSAPQKQSKQLQEIIGIDFTDIDNRYSIAYNDRTEKNRDAEKFHAKLIEMLEVPYCKEIDIAALQVEKETERTRLNGLYLENKAHNDKLRTEYDTHCRKIDADCEIFNKEQYRAGIKRAEGRKLIDALEELGCPVKEANNWWLELPDAQDEKSSVDYYPKAPEYIPELPDNATLQAIDEKIIEASQNNIRAAEYDNYIKYKQSVEAAKDLAEQADELVKSIEAERAKLIKSAKFPKGIAITPEGITVDGLPLDRNQISTSKLYTTALRIAAMNLGEVKTLYFDASFLDRNSLAEIEAWAEENDLQLLIERPDFDGGEIRYELIENTSDNQNQKAA